MLARLCHLLPLQERKKPVNQDPFVDTMISKELAKHNDPDIAFFSKRPRLHIEPGSSMHALFEYVTSSEVFAESLTNVLERKVPWPTEGMIGYAREQMAQHDAENAAAA